VEKYRIIKKNYLPPPQVRHVELETIRENIDVDNDVIVGIIVVLIFLSGFTVIDDTIVL
jgi:hypothetical protein